MEPAPRSLRHSGPGSASRVFFIAIGLGLAAFILYWTNVGLLLAIPIAFVGAALGYSVLRSSSSRGMRVLAVIAITVCLGPPVWFIGVATVALFGGSL